ncbi:WD40 repeat domain-containing protein, partial [Actinomadura miaoliensis]|uniref:WD40 repeat domain-containing protein n=1 Tax=Actinomadura miaoliensis TaxID=430685 RepID=UPI0031EE828A
AAAATVLGVVLSGGGADQRAGAEAQRLALGSADRQADEPDRALAGALAARALDPRNATVRGALLSAVTADTRTERVLATGATDPAMIALSGDGRLVAVVGRDGTPHVRDTRTGADVPPPGGIGRTTALAFAGAANGPLALAGGGRVLLWPPGGHAAAAPLPTAGRQPVSLAFSRDDRWLAAGCADGSVLLWDLSRLDAAPRTARAHKGAVRAVAFTPSGDAVLSTGDDRTVRSWRPRGGGEDRVWRGLGSPGRYIAVRADGSAVYVMTMTSVYFLASDLGHRLRAPVAVAVGGQLLYRRDGWIAGGRRADSLLLAVSNGVVEVPAEPGSVTQDDGRTPRAVNTTYARSTLTGSIAALSGDGALLAVPARTGAVRLYRQREGQDAYPRLRWVRAVHPVPGTRRELVVLGLADSIGAVALVDSGTRRLVASTELGRINYRGSAYLASARTLLVGGTGGLQTVTVEGDRLGRPAAVANPSSSGVYAVIDDERRHRLIVGWGDRVTVHDGGRGLSSPPRTIRVPPGEVSLAMSPDGERLFTVTGSGLYALRLRDGDPWAGRATLTRRRLARVVAFPDGVVVAASADGQVLRYRRDADRSWSESPLPGHGGGLQQLVAYRDSAVSIGTEGDLRITDAATGTPLATVRMPTVLFGRFATFGTASTARGLRVFDALNDTAVDVPLDDEAVRDRACAQLRAPSTVTVGDVWADAPSGVRDRRLCPPG